jgi:hypothetical protein
MKILKKMTFLNYLKDIKKIFVYIFRKKKYEYCFFIENEFHIKYLENYLKKKVLRNKKILIFSLSKINFNNIDTLYLQTNFFREFFFLTVSVKKLFTTSTNLNNSFFKKSLFSNVQYIYFQHSNISLLRNYEENAFHNFDVIQAINIFQYSELKEIREKYNLKFKIFKSRYQLLNNLQIIKPNKTKIYDFLIAPTWNSKFYEYAIHTQFAEILLENKLNFLLRPHPMNIKNLDFEKLKKLHIPVDKNPEIDFNYFNDLISDYSGIFIEFAIFKKKFPFLVNLEKKILNKNFSSYKNTNTIEGKFKINCSHTIDASQLNLFIEKKEKRNLNNEKIIISNLIKEFIF